MWKKLFLNATAVALMIFLARGAFAAEVATSTATVITVDGMHCVSCAKKVAEKLEKIDHVAKAAVDVKTGEATVTPKEKETPSAKLLWEAVERAGYKPTKLVGPSGTFTEKPKS
ncbi:MAG: heavy metal-associated domain-containing protein [Pirellulales bacterium]|nr:heavy metal-associated domain-containing protein [Pirellulales bacterium]